MYIESIEILKNHRNLVGGDRFPIRDITIVVGDQGCGKSTLLQALQGRGASPDFLKIHLTPLGTAGVTVHYFDSEKMNPRVSDPQNYVDAGGRNVGIGYGASLGSRFASHGEILKKYTVDGLNHASDAVLLFDEPESGLSLRNQFRHRDAVRAASHKKCQLIIATHSLVLIQSVPEVLSLEHRRWMPSEEFIAENSVTSKESNATCS